MGIIADIGGLTLRSIGFIFKKRGEAEKKKKETEKTLIQLRKEIYANRDVVNGLLRGGSLKSVKVNDEALVKFLARIKTGAMEKVQYYPRDYPQIRTKKTAPFFETLSITLSKINDLKSKSAMSDKELNLLPHVRLSLRVSNISKCLKALVDIG